ncbi:MAG: hypothetical protein R3A10_11510 [Caldilineaceae bacterium]
MAFAEGRWHGLRPSIITGMVYAAIAACATAGVDVVIPRNCAAMTRRRPGRRMGQDRPSGPGLRRALPAARCMPRSTGRPWQFVGHGLL